MKSKLLSYGFTGFFFFVLLAGLACDEKVARTDQDSHLNNQRSAQLTSTANLITMFMAGDVMTGRGIDQILPHPGDPLIYEPYMKS